MRETGLAMATDGGGDIELCNGMGGGDGDDANVLIYLKSVRIQLGSKYKVRWQVLNCSGKVC